MPIRMLSRPKRRLILSIALVHSAYQSERKLLSARVCSSSFSGPTMAIAKSHMRTSEKSGVSTAPSVRGFWPRGVAPRVGLYARAQGVFSDPAGAFAAWHGEHALHFP